jgi:hypothetical protein
LVIETVVSPIATEEEKTGVGSLFGDFHLASATLSSGLIKQAAPQDSDMRCPVGCNYPEVDYQSLELGNSPNKCLNNRTGL